MAIENFDQVTIAPAKLRPFSKFIMSIGELPTSYLDSLSYAEQVTWFCDYLQNHVIPTVNNNGEAVEELQNAYISFAQAVNEEVERFENNITTEFNNLEDFVNNYFENNFPALVQDTLDEMAEDGTLENLLNDAAHLIKVYNTYTDMIADSSTFTNGLRLKTSGYYSINDGGGANYYVSNILDTNKYQIELSNNLYLNIIVKDNTINIKQLGAYGDGTHEDYTPINNALTYYDKVIVPKGRFLISTTIDLTEKVGKNISGITNVSYGILTSEDSIILGNTGDDPIFNLLGARNITFENLTIISTDQTDTPSTLGILQGTTTNVQYSQWINLYNITINLATSDTANDNLGSIGVYNYQSELNNYNNVYIYADVPAIILNDDDFGIATSFGAIRSEHDSLSHNTYIHLMLHSKKTVAMYLSGSDLYFTGLYCQQGIVLRPQQTHSNQNVNINISGLIEEATIPFTFENSPTLQESSIKMQCVRAATLIGGTGVIVRSDITLTSDSATIFSDTSIRINLSSITKRGGLEIKNNDCQGNIIKGIGLSKIPNNNNFGLSDDGTILIDGKALIVTSVKPTRTDLPDRSIAINTGNNNNLGWRYSASTTQWTPFIPGNVIQTVSAQVANQAAGCVGQLAMDVNTHEFYIAYGTGQGEFRKITTTSIT